MKTLNGFYRGIIAQNNDPQRLGRVKVFVPHLHLASLDLDPEDYNKEFYFSEFGTNYNKSNPNMIDLTKYVEKIKLKLPWAEVSLPVTGGGFSSFNSSSNRASTSDSPYFVNQADEDGSTGTQEGALLQAYPPTDAFSASTTDTPNPLGSAYTTQSYYNAPKGMFGIPQVNTKVWLFFLEGNPNNPVVFGYSPSPNSYNQIYDDTTYPSGYENNDPTGEANPENLKRRNEFVINEKGGSIEINGTDGNEEVNIASAGGSFTKLGNLGRSNLNVGGQMTLTKGDDYTTIEGSHSFYCNDDVEYIVGKKLNITLGSTNYAAANEWMEIAENISYVKGLSERKIMDNTSVFSSPLAEKSGKNAPCEACSSDKKRPTYSGKSGVGSEENLNLFQKAQESILSGFDYVASLLSNAVDLKLPEITEEQFPKPENCPICKGTKESPSTMGGEYDKDERKEEIPQLYAQNAQRLFEAENEYGGGDLTMDMAGDMFINLGVPNNMDSIRVNPKGSSTTSIVEIDPEDGLYSTTVASSTVEKIHVDKPPGGQCTINAGHGLSLYSGSGGCEVSSTGCLNLYGTVTELTGEKVVMSSKCGMDIGTGETLSFNAANIAIESSGQTCMKGNISVDGNMKCTGGMMVQGEMFVQHITAPGVPQETEYQEDLFGEANSGSALKLGFLAVGTTFTAKIDGSEKTIEITNNPVPIVTTDSGQVGDPEAIFVYPHKHPFMGIPTTLYGTYGAARKNAVEMGMGGPKPILASPPQSGRAASPEQIPPFSFKSGVGGQNQLRARNARRNVIS